jgi:hypothetical protein
VAVGLSKARRAVGNAVYSGVCDKQFISLARNNSDGAGGAGEGGKFGLAAALDL